MISNAKPPIQYIVWFGSRVKEKIWEIRVVTVRCCFAWQIHWPASQQRIDECVLSGKNNNVSTSDVIPKAHSGWESPNIMQERLLEVHLHLFLK